MYFKSTLYFLVFGVIANFNTCFAQDLEAFKKESNQGIYLVELGKRYMQEGDFTRAAIQFKKAKKFVALDLKTYKMWIEALQRDGQHEKVVRIVSKSPKMVQNTATIQFLEGDSYYQMGRKAKAKTSFETALKLDSKFIAARIRLADIAYSNSDWNQVIGNTKLILEQEPENLRAKRTLGITYTRIGKFSEGIQLLEEVVSTDQSNKLAWYYLGLAQKQSAQFTDRKSVV